MTLDFLSLAGSQCWQLTALILIVGVLGATLLRHRPQLVYLLWGIVFVKSLTLPIWSSPTSIFSWLDPHISADVADFGYLVPAPSPVAPTVEPSSQVDLASAVNVSDSAMRDSVSLGADALSAMLVIWLLGVLVLLVLAGRRWLEVYQSVRRQSAEADEELVAYANRLAGELNISSQVRVVVSQANLGPMVFGSRHPLLILPAGLAASRSPTELRPIVAHELVHASRGDTTFGALQFISQVIWWFHPLVWWASRQANRISERCCDEEVIARFGFRPREYAQCLLDALELRARLSTTPALPGIRSVDITRTRVDNIMRNSNQFRPSSPSQHWIFALILALLVLPGGGYLLGAGDESSVTAPPKPTLAAQADRAVANEEWDAAAEAFRELTEQQPNNGRAWFMLGYSLHADGQIDLAIEAHQRAAEFPRAKRTALYNLACAYALKSDRDRAINALTEAIDAGFVSPTPIERDTDFASLTDDAEFQSLAKAAKPPAEREVYRQFDFWVGSWDVFGRNGQQVGTNTITKDEQGFLLTEKWTNSGGSTGTSINYYDPSDKQWKQTWVDAGGNVVHYSGGLVDGKMSLQGRLTKPDGTIVQSRVSFALNGDGSVRQHVEQSSDEGKTWTTYFDGKYVRRGS